MRSVFAPNRVPLTADTAPMHPRDMSKRSRPRRSRPTGYQPRADEDFSMLHVLLISARGLFSELLAQSLQMLAQQVHV